MRVLIFTILVASLQSLGQDRWNLPFSPNPRAKEKEQSTPSSIISDTTTVSKKPTEIYKVGIGDVLEIKLQGFASGREVKVSEDGTIEYPLTRDQATKVVGLTVEEIEALLMKKVNPYGGTKVSVKVKKYESHKVTVFGLVEHQGVKILRREAVPLYVILSEAVPYQNARKAEILRSGEKFTVGIEELETLIYPGDVIRITGEEAKKETQKPRFYYINGPVVSPGQKEFYDGMTLTQAIAASGGLVKSSVKKATIWRRESDGRLVSIKHDLKAIKDGKKPDPELKEGDIIEVED